MGEDMVERVAKALYEAMYPQERNQHLPEWFVAGDGCRDLFMGYARTAIQALRDPTEPMMEASFKECRNNGRVAWQAMIDAALSGAQK